MPLLFWIFAIVLLTNAAYADELILPPTDLRHSHLLPVYNTRTAHTEPPYQQHQLSWPVKQTLSNAFVSQNFINFQQYGNASYFHGGADLRTTDDAPIFAPVSGRLEAGYYGYALTADGHLNKRWRPWDGAPVANPYFEVAIVTNDGYRFEFHHVDALKLPQTIINKLNSPDPKIEKGEIAGYVYGEPFQDKDYVHIHYNIIAPDGSRLNPEFYSEKMNDTQPPHIHKVIAVYKDGETKFVTSNKSIAKFNLEMIVVLTNEARDKSNYVQTPPVTTIQFYNVQNDPLSTFSWNFQKFMSTEEGTRPNIQQMFTDSIKVGRTTLKTYGQYGKGNFLINLPVDNEIEFQKFKITVADTNGNENIFQGEVH